jgi:hypothetical protein
MAEQAALSGRVGVEGLKELQNNLQALGADKTEFQQANFEAAERLIRRAKPLIPVKSGKLLASVRAGKAAGYAEARAGLKSVPYANVIHWGWLVVGKRSKSSLPVGTYKGIAPQPFFSEALGYSYEEIISDYYEALGDLMAKHNLN